MVSDGFFSELLLLGLWWLYVMLLWAWPLARVIPRLTPPPPAPPSRQRPGDPKPFPGLTHSPHWAACAQAAQEPATLLPSAPPPPLIPSRGRARQVDPAQQFCPHPHCAYYGRVGSGNLQANGHPHGGPWRQWPCTACTGYFLEPHGTPLHGKRVAADQRVWAVGALAEGLGSHAVARVFTVDPKTVLAWLVG
jgi:hypothetical protein